MSTTKIHPRATMMVTRAVSTPWRLALLLIVGLLVRIAFMGNEGFRNDIDTFEGWTIALAQHPFWQFYSPKMFADYPPGYFYVLALIGHVYALIAPHGNLVLLKYLIKVPAVLMDLVDGVVIYAVARRFTNETWALVAAAVFVLNPAAIFNSAAWGQVDSISAGLALIAIWQLLRSNDEGVNPIPPIVLAWLAIGYSILIKPQSAVIVPLMIAFVFVAPQWRRVRTLGTVIGIAAAIVLAWALALPFHPTANPLALFAWLYEKYQFGKSVYPYSSVNAFNLWSIKNAFWQPDSETIFGLTQAAWGVLLTLAAIVLVLVRYLQARTDRALLEGAALLSLAFFMLATRMHERYLFGGLLFTIAAIPLARRYLTASLIFTATLFVNLVYSLTYLQVVLAQTPGVNAQDLWPAVTHPLSLLNVATFFYLGYVYLGQETTATRPFRLPAFRWPVARAWFNPREGLARMVWPLDYALAAGCGVVAFFVSFVNYWQPGTKIFDEIYFARAAEEYLTHQYIYENTHPPLTKLIITLSTMLFGGMHGGDNAWGWRFIDVLCGAIVVVVLYAFAKRLTRSSLFATMAAVMLTADGMHFVQSRIATPEGIVVVFSLGTLYAFYRFWIASQSVARSQSLDSPLAIAISLALALGLGALGSYIVNLPAIGGTSDRASFVTFWLLFACGFYLLFRVIAPKTGLRFVSYPEGTAFLEGTKQKNRSLQLAGASIAYKADGTAAYATPEGSATYTPGVVTDDLGEREEGRHAGMWLFVCAVLLGALVSSKWYGVMAYGVSFIVILAVASQKYWPSARTQPARWGNPHGWRADVAIATIAFVSLAVYALVWIPDMFRHIEIQNIHDLIYRQYTMFMYHDTLKATHPYMSSWWQWPLDLRPIAYFWNDSRAGAAAGDPGACCVREIISLPNPLILWFGLATVPLVGFLAWRERNKGYALLVLAYLLQWLPWSRSPRITFAYHFYVDIPLIVLCNVIVLQRIWEWNFAQRESRLYARLAVAIYAAAVVAAFAWFYPILAAQPLVWNAWHARMWLGNHWV